jgi:citrate lyase subunit gamma (acyl carrier protein)
MELKVKAIAGTLESSDIQIIIEPNTSGIEIELESAVFAQYEEDILRVIKDSLEEIGVAAAKVYANDKGAIDPVIKSRVQTAAYRSAMSTDFQWK